MIKVNTLSVWLGIVLISGLFLTGQDAWSPCIDEDGDGYGGPGSSACAYPERDCDDGNDHINPGVAEGPHEDPSCHDSLDNDCDGAIDDEDEGCCICNDQDGDGYGSPGCWDCLYPEQDCDDSSDQVSPG